MALVLIENPPVEEWEANLYRLGGHPLQSHDWGEVKAAESGEEDLRLAIAKKSESTNYLWMARIEVRRLFSVLTIGWIPRGPVVASDDTAGEAQMIAMNYLSNSMKLDVLVASSDAIGGTKLSRQTAENFVVDTSQKIESLRKNLHKEFRYGTKKAEEKGVELCHEIPPNEFWKLYEITQRDKAFLQVGSLELLELLMRRGIGKIFGARVRGELAAAAVIVKTQSSVHYFWGATNREYSEYRASEYLHWEIMKWAHQGGYKKYDLEGADRINNPGVYRFKKRFGGQLEALPAERALALNLLGRFVILGLMLRARL